MRQRTAVIKKTTQTRDSGTQPVSVSLAHGRADTKPMNFWLRTDTTVAVSVWLIEDNQLYRQTIEELVNQTSQMHCDRAFSNCEDALEALHDDPPPDVILLDVGLPGMDGIDGVSRIKALSPTSQIIILTVHDDETKVFNAICAGAAGYLLKASSPDSIIAAINDVLRGGAPINPQIARKVLDEFARVNAPKIEYGLTAREKEILQLLVQGYSKQRIAETIFVSFHTVDFHLRNIYSKLQVNTRTSAVAKTLKERLV